MVQHSYEKFVPVTLWMIGFQVCMEPIEDTFLYISNELACIIWARVKFMESFWCTCEDTKNCVLRRWALMDHDECRKKVTLNTPGLAHDRPHSWDPKRLGPIIYTRLMVYTKINLAYSKEYVLSIRLTYNKHVIWHHHFRIFYTLMYDT